MGVAMGVLLPLVRIAVILTGTMSTVTHLFSTTD